MSDPSPWDEPAARVLALMRAGRDPDAFALLDELAADPARVTPADPLLPYNEVAGALYWKHHAVPEYVRLCRERVRRLEALAAAGDAEEKARLVPRVGGTCYNLASSVWPGWDDEGIVIGPEERKAGAEAAARCLEVRLDPAHAEMKFGYSPAMAHWVVGAHHLAAGEHGLARGQFSRSREQNRGTGPAEELDSGYLAIVSLLERPGDAAAAAEFDAATAALEARTGDEDAAFYRSQLLTARRVFGA